MALRGFIIAAAAAATYCYYDFSPLYQAHSVFIYSQYLFIYLSVPSVRTRRGVSVVVNGVSCVRFTATRGTRLASDRTIIVGHRAKPVRRISVGRSFRNGRARAL